MTLTETARFTKRFLLFGGIFIVALILVWTGSLYYKNYLYSKIPKVAEKPDLKFGLLPKLKFIENGLNSASYTYSLDTPTGALPEKLPPSFKIYAIPELGNTFLAADKARELAAKFNFNLDPEIISPTVHKFTNPNGGEFSVDITTGNFNLKQPVATQSAQDIIELQDIPNLSQQFRNFLTEKQLLTDGLKDGDIKANYHKASSPDQFGTSTISLWQQKIDDYKIVTDSYNNGLIEATVTGDLENLNNYQTLNYIYWPVDQKTFAIYPLKTADDAFNDLKNGQAAVVQAPQSTKASINSVYLAYFLSKDYPEYLQPIFVFEGENFVAYVQAVTSQYVK